MKTFFFDNQNYGEWQHKSYSIGFVGSHVFNEDYFFRLRAGVTNINALWYQDTRNDYSGLPIYYIADINIKQNRYYFAPSIAGQLKKNFYGLHGGFELPITIHKNYIRIFTETDYDSTFTTVAGQVEYTTTAPGGYSFGLGMFAGFSFYILNHFSIGAELSSAFLYSELGGRIETETLQTIPTNFTATTYFQYKFKGLNYSGERISFNILYLF